jgi:hypothetical protein
MIRHVVMWTLKDDLDKKAYVQEIKTKLESLKGKIEGLVSLEVGINEKESAEGFDICLITEHPDWEALQFYQDHPAHKEVADFIGQVRKGRAVVDFHN